MVFRAILPLTLLLVIAGGCETDYEDRFALTPPKEQSATFTFPGIASVKLTQTAGTSNTYPAPDANLKAFLTRLDTQVGGTFAVVIRAYTQPPLIAENLGFTKTVTLTQFASADTVTIDFGSSYVTPLKKELVQVEIIDSGMPAETQSAFRGSYAGIYTVAQDTEILHQGAVEGIVNYKGETTIEVSGIDAFRFVKGQIIQEGDDINVYYSAVSTEGEVVAPLTGKLTLEGIVLKGELEISVPQFNKFSLTISPR